MILSFETICAAVKGDKDAIEEVLKYYDPYIVTMCTFQSRDEDGFEYTYVDHDAIDKDDIGSLNRVAENEAAHIWQDFMPFLLEQTQGLTNRYDDGFQFWETIQYPKQVFGRIFIELIKTAAAALIRRNPACFIELSEPYHDCDSIVINEVLLFIMNELPQQYSDFVVAWFIDNPRKHFFEYTSENDEHLTLAKTAIRKHSKDCSVELFAQLETVIYYYHEENEYENAKCRFKYNHDRRESAANEMFFYSYWGEVQYYLLNALDETRISEKTKGLIKVLSRKFAYPPASHVRAKTTGGMVHSSISDAADKISDAQWLRIINNNKASRHKYARNEIRGHLIESSPMLFARDLENLGEKDPNRVAKLALRFDEEVDFNYVNAVFITIGKTEQNEKTKDTITWRIVDKDIAEQLFLKFGNRLDVATEYSRAIEKRSSEDWCDEVLFRISEIAKNHPNPETGKWNIYSSADKECETVNSLITNSMNCTRGCATIAIGSLLWENKARYSVLESAIKAAVFDDHLAVNMAAVECILPMCNFDTDTAINWFSYLIEKDIRLAAHYSAKNMYYHIFMEHEEFVKQTVLKMYYSEYDDVSETGAKYIANIYFLYGHFGDVIYSETQKTSAQIKGILHISIELLKYPEHFERSKEIIEFLIECVDTEASFMLSRILECDTLDAKNDTDFIIKIITSKRSRLMMHCLSDYIEKSNSSLVVYSDIIFAICDNLIKQAKNGTEDPSSDLYGIAEPVSKLIAKLYEQSKDYPDSTEINQQCLNMWDLMFEYRIGTIRELSQSIMEQ